MSGVFWATYVVLWIFVVSLLFAVLLLYRQFGLMLMPGRKRMSLNGLDIGAAAPPLALTFSDAKEPQIVEWGRRSNAGPRLGSLLVFALPLCPLCEELSRTVGVLPSVWPDVEFIWIGEAPPPLLARPGGWRLALGDGQQAHEAMEVPGSPFVYAIKPDGTVGAKGLINNASEMSSLLMEGFGPPETTSWVLPRDGGVLTQDGEVVPMRQTGEPSATGRPEGR
jgi:hypothetical protein